MQQAWWRVKPLSEQEAQLLDAIGSAHHLSVFRPNPSTVSIIQAFEASGDFTRSIAAGLLTMGGRHAPLERTYRFLSLEYPQREVASFLRRQEKVPGWGGTFQKDKPDPLWVPVNDILAETQAALSAKLDAVTIELHRLEKPVYPNPSAYTAAAAIVVGLPLELCPYLFIAGRLMGWTQVIANELEKERKG